MIPTSSLMASDGIADGNDFANSMFNQLSGVVQSQKSPNIIDSPDYTASPEEINISDGEFKEKSNQILNDDNNHAAKFLKDSIEKDKGCKKKGENCQDYKFLEENWFLNSEKISKDPAKSINAKCTRKKNGEGSKIEKYKIRVEDYKTIEEDKYCSEPTIAKYSCNRTLSLTCKGTEECNRGGIIRDTIKADDMMIFFEYPYLTIGTIADNHWHANCEAFERNTSFKIKNVKDLEEFKIVQAGFDDYFLIKVNGTTVYVGPDGGDKLEIKDTIVTNWFGYQHSVKKIDNGKGIKNCERGTSWNKSLNIDIIPYLKEGDNVIHTKTIVAGAGEGWLKIKVKQHCCNEWEENWVDECEEIRK